MDDTALQVSNLAVRTQRSRRATINFSEAKVEPVVKLTALRALDSESLTRMEAAAFQYGQMPQSYDLVRAEGSMLQTPCGEGYLNIYNDGRYWHIPGGIIGDEGLKPNTVRWLKDVAARQRLTVAVYSVSKEDVPLYQEAGYCVNKLGEEPILNLRDLDWKGKSFEWVRRQTNYCQRQGLQMQEITSQVEQRLVADELNEVFCDDMRERVLSKPLRLLDGEFDPHTMGRRRLFVARGSDSSRVQGFLIANPMNGGKSWAFEMYRKRQDSVRGTIPFLFREVIDRLRDEGCQTVSLCLVPGKGMMEDTFPNRDKRLQWVLHTWYKRLGFWFDVSGQDYFKSRFRPEYQDRYLCVYPKTTWFSILSFLKTTGALQINGFNLVQQVGRGFRSAG